VEELSEAAKLLRKEKLELDTDLLAKLEELKKARVGISLLCEAVGERGTEIDSFQSQLDEERKEKLELRGRVWGQTLGLEVSSRDRECLVDELRAVVSLSDCNLS